MLLKRATGEPSLSPTSTERIASWMDSGALFVLLLVIAMRPLLTETYDSSLHSIARVLQGSEVITPARTAWFGAAIWLATIAAMLSTALRGVYWRWTGAEPGWILLLFAATISTLITSNRRLATNASCDWLTTLLMLFALANLCRNRLRVALVLTVLTASGVTSAAKCVMQMKAEFAETRDLYNSTREEFWQSQNIPLDDARVQLFERRMNAEEASGFFPSSNTQGAWLSLAGFAALGCASLVGTKRQPRLIFSAVAAMLFAMIYPTGSKGAGLAAVVGLIFWLLLGRLQEKLRARWRSVLVAAWIVVFLAASAVGIWGSIRGGLPGSSLAFRWQYWQVTSHIIADHVWTGVGALNFDRAYLLLKPVEFPEEIKDPHNFVLAILAQWGLLGAAGLALLSIGASIRIGWTWGQGAEDRLYGVPEEIVRYSTPQWVAVLIGGFLLLRSWVFRHLWVSNDLAEQASAFFDIGFYGLIWSLVIAGALWVFGRSDGGISKKYKLAALCAAGAFVLHNTIDYATFYPGALTPFLGLSALLLAGRQQRIAGRGTSIFPRLVPAGVLALLFILYSVITLVPVTLTSHSLLLARSLSRSDPQRAAACFEAAAGHDRLDPTPFVELAALHAQQPGIEHVSKAVACINKALERDPLDSDLYHFLSRLLEMRYRAGGSQSDLLMALGAGRRALDMYPNSPDEHVMLADLLAFAADEFNLSDLAAEAVQHYRHALELDERRPGSDEVRRWSLAQRQEISRRIANLAAPGSAPATSPTTIPAS